MAEERRTEGGEKLVFTLVSLSDLFGSCSEKEKKGVSGNIKEWLKGNKSRRSHNLLASDINLIFMIRRILNCLPQLKVLAGRKEEEGEGLR
jgi:hypothetical protein